MAGGGRRGGRGRASLLLVVALPMLGIIAVLGTYLVLSNRRGWNSGEIGNALEVTVFAAGAVVALGGVASSRWSGDRRSAPGHSGSVLEDWRRLLRNEVMAKRVRDEGSQLVQMVRQAEVVEMLTAPVDLDTDADVIGSPRLRVGRRTLGLREIKAHWDRSPHRLVVLGEPGHGKTVALLSLLGQVNGAVDQPGRPVAELFSLTEWAGWEAARPGAPLAAWLAESLVLTYPQLDLDRATARQLVDSGLVLPLLDGLNEVPEARRVRCRDTINAYAGRSSPHRPFALTCRPAEYRALAPDWVAADEQVHLLPLNRRHIEQQVSAEVGTRPGWTGLRRRLQRGDRQLLSLLGSPLRLAIALDAYRTDSPDELVGIEPAQAEDQLWERLLAQGAAGVDGDRVRGWLRFIAQVLRREGRQTFHLHDLHLYAPDRDSEIRLFTIVLGCASTVLAVLVAGSAAALLATPTIGLVAAGAALWVFSHGWLLRDDDERERRYIQPAIYERARPTRERLRAIAAELVAVGLVSLVLARFIGLERSLLLGLCIGLPVGQSTVLDEYLHGRRPITAEPPARLGRPGPDAVLRLSLRNGLTWGLVLGQYIGLCVGAVAAIAGGMYMALWGAGLHDIVDFAVATWLTVFLVVGLTAGLGLALNRGLGPWLFHHWLRYRFARQGLLPRRLPDFLAMCAAPERGWLRGPAAFEFRHQGLLEHLAGDVPPREKTRATTGAEDDKPLEGLRLLKDFGLITVVMAGLALAASLVWTTGEPEFDAVYVAGDKPVRWYVSPEATDDVDTKTTGLQWELGPGEAIEVRLRAEPGYPLAPSTARPHDLHGGLTLLDCPEGVATWHFAVGGQTIDEGTVRRRRGTFGVRWVMLGGDFPETSPSTDIVLTTRRTDDSNCTAQLVWIDAGFDVAGIGSWR